MCQDHPEEILIVDQSQSYHHYINFSDNSMVDDDSLGSNNAFADRSQSRGYDYK